jgi:hypothetical protein
MGGKRQRQTDIAEEIVATTQNIESLQRRIFGGKNPTIFRGFHMRAVVGVLSVGGWYVLQGIAHNRRAGLYIETHYAPQRDIERGDCLKNQCVMSVMKPDGEVRVRDMNKKFIQEHSPLDAYRRIEWALGMVAGGQTWGPDSGQWQSVYPAVQATDHAFRNPNLRLAFPAIQP